MRDEKQILVLCGAGLQQGSSTSDKRTIISEIIDSGKVVIMENWR
jgi:hypothetical protein